MFRDSLVMTGLWFTFFVPSVWGQATKPDSEPALSIKVVQLNHLDAHSAAEVLKNIGLPLAVAALDENRLVLRGAENDIDGAIKQVLTAMDVPQAGADGSTGAHLFQLRNIPSGLLLHMLETATAGARARFALDPANRVLVVNAPTSEQETVRLLLDQLDRESPPLTMQFYFIRGALSPGKEEKVELWPAGLSSVAKALREIGMSHLELLAPMIVRTDSNWEFFSQGTLRRQASEEGRSENLNLEVKGTSRLLGDAKTVQLKLEASLRGDFVKDAADAGKAAFNLQTTITAKLDDFVVVSASPTTTSEGDAVALAVRVSAK